MKITSYKTPKITAGAKLFDILDQNLPKIAEKSIVVVTSKIVSICEDRLIKNDGTRTKMDLAKIYADYYHELPKFTEKFGGVITLTYGNLIFNAGIDESNGGDYFILWPKDPIKSAESIWEYLKKRGKIKNLGIIISDSHLIPTRWGTRGFGLSWCGFEALKDYIGKPDIFGHPLKHTKLSIIDGLSAGAIAVMGEGNEQTPLAVISDIPFVNFCEYAPTKAEINDIKISMEDDVYGPLLQTVKWEKGRAPKSNN